MFRSKLKKELSEQTEYSKVRTKHDKLCPSCGAPAQFRYSHSFTKGQRLNCRYCGREGFNFSVPEFIVPLIANGENKEWN